MPSERFSGSQSQRRSSGQRLKLRSCGEKLGPTVPVTRQTGPMYIVNPKLLHLQKSMSYLEVCCQEAQVQGCICTQCSIGFFLQLALVESCDESLRPEKAEMSNFIMLEYEKELPKCYRTVN